MLFLIFSFLYLVSFNFNLEPKVETEALIGFLYYFVPGNRSLPRFTLLLHSDACVQALAQYI